MTIFSGNLLRSEYAADQCNPTSPPCTLFHASYLMLVLPALWTHHEHEPGLSFLPMVIRNADGIPGDALDVGLVGRKEYVFRIMHEAGWFSADPITFRTSIEIVGSVVLGRPYRDAPVNPLYYEGRRENSPSKSPMAGVRTVGITSGSGRFLRREQTAARYGLVQ